MIGEPIAGSCLCGRCTYSATAEPIDVRVCHCTLCQRATGGPFFARVRVPRDKVSIAGPVGWHHSSPEVRRGFCKQCGTMLFSERASANTIGFSMGSLDNPDRFSPADHIWVSRRQAWFALPDDLPCYDEFPPG